MIIARSVVCTIRALSSTDLVNKYRIKLILEITQILTIRDQVKDDCHLHFGILDNFYFFFLNRSLIG